MKHKPVSSVSGSIPKATTKYAGKSSSDMMGMPGGMGGQHMEHTPAGDCPKLSKLD